MTPLLSTDPAVPLLYAAVRTAPDSDYRRWITSLFARLVRREGRVIVEGWCYTWSRASGSLMRDPTAKVARVDRRQAVVGNIRVVAISGTGRKALAI